MSNSGGGRGSLPGEDARRGPALPLLSLVASGQITLRRIYGWRKIAVLLSQNTLTLRDTCPIRLYAFSQTSL